MNVIKKILLMILLVFIAMTAVAKDKVKTSPAKSKGDGAKELSGISIVGNKEAPKSLFIVPWKSSELGVETGLASSLLNEKLKTVDKDVFERELEFYSVTVDKSNR